MSQVSNRFVEAALQVIVDPDDLIADVGKGRKPEDGLERHAQPSSRDHLTILIRANASQFIQKALSQFIFHHIPALTSIAEVVDPYGIIVQQSFLVHSRRMAVVAAGKEVHSPSLEPLVKAEQLLHCLLIDHHVGVEPEDGLRSKTPRQADDGFDELGRIVVHALTAAQQEASQIGLYVSRQRGQGGSQLTSPNDLELGGAGPPNVTREDSP